MELLLRSVSTIPSDIVEYLSIHGMKDGSHRNKGERDIDNRVYKHYLSFLESRGYMKKR